MDIDPELYNRQPRPFILSIEPCNRPSFRHGFHLGTDEALARTFAKEIFERHRANGDGLYTVALLREDKIFDVWDGRDWFSAIHDEDWFWTDAEQAHEADLADERRHLINNADIVDIPELVGRTITAASTWADGDSLSLVLDDGSILQIAATIKPGDGKPIEEIEPQIRWEIEFPTKV